MLLGAICLTKLPVDLLPKVSLPTVAVITQWPNVAPEEMETQSRGRSSRRSPPRPTSIRSAPAPRRLLLGPRAVQLRDGHRAGGRRCAAAGGARPPELPDRPDAADAHRLQNRPVAAADPDLWRLGRAGPGQAEDGTEQPGHARSSQSANGVASAVATGGLDRAIIVDVDPDKLQAYHLSLAQVSKRIVQENLDLPAGIAKQSNTEYTIRSLGYFNSPQETANIPVGSFNGQLVALEQVANVARLLSGAAALHAPERAARRRHDHRQAERGEHGRHRQERAGQSWSRSRSCIPNLNWGLAYDQSQFIVNSIDDVKNSALIGGALAIIILLFFLRNFRSTLVVALSIPISIISTFALLYVCGFTLNTLSLSGLSLATGLIVDDAVVVLENIFRHIERDKKRPAEAAVTGTKEITSAVVASTITIMVVFLPLLLIKGQAGQMFTAVRAGRHLLHRHLAARCD